MSVLLTVQPEVMVSVTLAYPAGPVLLNAIMCRYVAATAEIDGVSRRIVTVEIVYDPANPNPLQAYLCDPNGLAAVTVPPNVLKEVRPYLL